MTVDQIYNESRSLTDVDRYHLIQWLVQDLTPDSDPMYPGGLEESIQNVLADCNFQNYLNSLQDTDLVNKVEEEWQGGTNGFTYQQMVSKFHLDFAEPSWLTAPQDFPISDLDELNH